VQTHAERVAWLRGRGWEVGPDIRAGILAATSPACTYIETPTRSGWLTHETGLILWHGFGDQEFADFVREVMEPPKPVQKRRSLFEEVDDGKA